MIIALRPILLGLLLSLVTRLPMAVLNFVYTEVNFVEGEEPYYVVKTPDPLLVGFRSREYILIRRNSGRTGCTTCTRWRSSP